MTPRRCAGPSCKSNRNPYIFANNLPNPPQLIEFCQNTTVNANQHRWPSFPKIWQGRVAPQKRSFSSNCQSKHLIQILLLILYYPCSTVECTYLQNSRSYTRSKIRCWPHFSSFSSPPWYEKRCFSVKQYRRRRTLQI